MRFVSVAQSDDLLTEILLRLPAKPLTRFKCVSKEWLALISNPHFVRRYLTSHPFPSSLLLTLNSTDLHVPPVSLPVSIIPLRTSDADVSLPKLLDFGFLNVPDLVLRQSCHGLLLVEGREIGTQKRRRSSRSGVTKAEALSSFFVCSPLTKRFVAFRAVMVSSFFLAYDPLKSLHFKLVSVPGLNNFDYRRTLLLKKRKITIYSSEIKSWSDTGVCFTTPSSSYMNFRQGVYCNGSIHCICNLTIVSTLM
ncbi:F-box protein [Spatholobus suberectus]|nr:F-box protein [Spatholobus suberectus]